MEEQILNTINFLREQKQLAMESYENDEEMNETTAAHLGGMVLAYDVAIYELKKIISP